MFNLLKSWGLSDRWWQGQRGEYWALAQGVLFLGFILLPQVSFHPISSIWRTGLALGFGLGATTFLVWGLLSLGNNLTPLPHPKVEGELVTSGIYSIVRHPIYTAVIFLALAYSCWLWSWLHALGSLGFFVFFDAKARQEEIWLCQKFPTYDRYRQQVKKLIPRIY